MRTFIALVVLTLCAIVSPVLRWWNPTMIPINRRAFTVEELQKFEKEDITRKQERIATAIAKRVFQKSGVSCTPELASSISKVSRSFQLSPRIVAATVVAESSCRPNEVSEAGAVGLMQVMPRVWGVPRKELLDPDKNLQEGTKILARYVKQTGNVRDGLRYYFGVTEGSTAADEYADRVLEIAKR